MTWVLTILFFLSFAGNLYLLTLLKKINMGSITETITAFTARINEATNGVANDIKNWKAAFESNNVTPEILADMDAKVATLEALAAEDSPVPDAEGEAPTKDGGTEEPSV
jgi:hypothetical protein